MFDFKTASKAELQERYNQIAKEIGDDQFFTKKELHHLPSVLGTGEQVLAFTSGLMDGNTWLIALTDQRVIFLDKGMIYGLKQASIPLEKVNAVMGQTGLLFGKIVIEDGASKREITNVWKKTVMAFTNKMRDAMDAQKTVQHRQSSAPPATDDVISKLERLSALKASGVLSQEEFEQQKAIILRV
jgi:hypothetical protein